MKQRCLGTLHRITGGKHRFSGEEELFSVMCLGVRQLARDFPFKA